MTVFFFFYNSGTAIWLCSLRRISHLYKRTTFIFAWKFICAWWRHSPTGNKVLRPYKKVIVIKRSPRREIQVTHRKRLSSSYSTSRQDDRIIFDKCYNAGTILSPSKLKVVHVLGHRWWMTSKDNISIFIYLFTI